MTTKKWGTTKEKVNKAIEWLKKWTQLVKDAKKLTRTKLPRIWDTEMSWVFSKKINKSIEKDFKDTDNIRARSKAAAGYYGYSSDKLKKQGKPTAKEVLRSEVGNPIKIVGKTAANIATIPNRAVRNLYNTAADIYNASVSKRLAKDAEKQAAKSKKNNKK